VAEKEKVSHSKFLGFLGEDVAINNLVVGHGGKDESGDSSTWATTNHR
jgi:hypothetical protein